MATTSNTIGASIMMKTSFKSQDLWELVENGGIDSSDDQERDAKAIFIIQQAMNESILSRIATTTTWTTIGIRAYVNSYARLIPRTSEREETNTLGMEESRRKNFLGNVVEKRDTKWDKEKKSWARLMEYEYQVDAKKENINVETVSNSGRKEDIVGL
ncbi:hypothetical protein Tco_0841119 [Tanacetum coccineum]|uniref:Uncharacterized protein n=1 Tax=Tanacetum coccineum TaxID=301880 RepID=A0ABQ5AYZ0_9ASTR